MVGFHPDTAWQLKQVLDAGMCVLALPLAERPLWQLAQSVDELNPAWSTLAGVQRSFEWQLAQFNCVATWLLDLPVACVPLWQLAQLVDELNTL